MRSHSSIGACSIGPNNITPALLITVSSLPSSVTTRSTTLNASSRLVTSAWMESTDAPEAVSLAASSSSRSTLRATNATAAPC